MGLKKEWGISLTQPSTTTPFGSKDGHKRCIYPPPLPPPPRPQHTHPVWSGFEHSVPAVAKTLSPNFLTFKKPRNRIQGIESASQWSLAGQYDNLIPTRFPVPTDCSKIPALASCPSLCPVPTAAGRKSRALSAEDVRCACLGWDSGKKCQALALRHYPTANAA